jgi:hypothetical protein
MYNHHGLRTDPEQFAWALPVPAAFGLERSSCAPKVFSISTQHARVSGACVHITDVISHQMLRALSAG